MKRKYRLKIFISLFVVFSSIIWCYAEDQLYLRSTNIKETFTELSNNLSNNELWEDYLTVFPDTKEKFTQIFAPDDFAELYYNSHEYIFILKQAPAEFSQEIINLIFNISKAGAPGCCDAWSALNNITTDYAISNADVFFDLLQTLKMGERKNVIKFMADKEAIQVSKSYQKIIEILKSKNENDLFLEFEKARSSRMAKPQ